MTYSLIIVTVLAAAGVFLQVTAVHTKEPVAGAEIRARLEAATRLILEKETASARAFVASAAFDKYLVAGTEELDGYAAMKALQHLCREGGFSSCRLFDAEGEFLADQLMSVDSETADEHPSPPPKPQKVADFDKVYAAVSSTDEGIFVLAQGPVAGSAGRIGWLELVKPLAQGLCRELAETAGLTAGAATLRGALFCSSAENNLAQALQKEADNQPFVAGSARAVGSLTFLVSEFCTSEGEPPLFLLLGEQIGRSAVQSGGIDGRMLAAVLAVVLVFMVSVVMHIRRGWRQPLLAAAQQLASFEFMRASESRTEGVRDVLQKQGPPEMQRLAARVNEMTEVALSECRRLRLEKQQTDARLAKVAELLRIGDGAFRIFLEKAYQFERTCSALLAALDEGGDPLQIAGQLLRHTYNLKSNARLFNFRHIDQPALDLEEYLISTLRHATPDRGFAVPVRQQLDRIRDEVAGYVELRTRVMPESGSEEALHSREYLRSAWIMSVTGRLFAWLKNPERDPLVASRLHAEYRSAVSSFGKEDLKEYVRRFDRMLASMGKAQGKRLKQLEVTGNYQHFSPEIMQHLNDVFLHCLRNAFDHGLETPARREATGKAPAGTIVIESNYYSGICSIVLRDDGRGIDPGQLRSIAVERRLCSVAEARELSDRQLLDMLFRTGFTTASFTSDTSGRGVGMDTVRQIVRAMGGEVWVESEVGEGTAVHMHFPVSEFGHATGHGLFNPVVGTEHAAAAAAAIAPALNVTVLAPQQLRERGLVVCDRYLFSESIQCIIRQAAASGATSIELALDHLRQDGVTSLEAYALQVTVTGGKKNVSPVDTGFESRLFAMLTEAGIVLNDDRATEGVFELRLTGAASGWFGERKVTAVVPDSMLDAMRALFTSVAAERFPSVRVHVVSVGELECGSETPGDGAIMVLDDATLADERVTLFYEAARTAASVVMICDDMESLNRERLFFLVRNPLIVEDMLDAESAAANIELSLERRLFRLTQEAKGVAGLEAA